MKSKEEEILLEYGKVTGQAKIARRVLELCAAVAQKGEQEFAMRFAGALRAIAQACELNNLWSKEMQGGYRAAILDAQSDIELENNFSKRAIEKIYLSCLGLYIGAQVKINNGGIYILGSANDDGTYIILNPGANGVNGKNFDPKEFKLLLRPLSSITEAEEEEWKTKHSTPIRLMNFASDMQMQWDKWLNYCRSIGIDCDGLIESGKAIMVDIKQ